MAELNAIVANLAENNLSTSRSGILERRTLGIGHGFVVAAFTRAAKADADRAPCLAVIRAVAQMIAQQVSQFMRHGVVEQVLPAAVLHHVGVEAQSVDASPDRRSTSRSTAKVEAHGVGHASSLGPQSVRPLYQYVKFREHFSFTGIEQSHGKSLSSFR